jgi:hypothetical protein
MEPTASSEGLMKKSTEMPTTEQQRFHVDGSDLGSTNAVPACTEYDLEKVPSRTRFGSWGDEQTFKVPKRGNCVTKGKNY